MKVNSWSVLSLVIATLSGKVPEKKTIWMIGDSTMSVKQASAYPETGWGMPFVHFWDSTVEVRNLAMNGRSTRSFLEENRWKPVVDGLKKGDIVFIQFGHNDEVPSKKTYVPETQYVELLQKYIDETRSHGGEAVLLTPVARRKFDSTGHVVETHAVYSGLVRQVAAQRKVMLVDLDQLSMSLYETLGEKASAYLFNHLLPGEHPNYPEGKKDDTHFNESGARRVAELVLGEIRLKNPALAKHIVNRVVKN